MKKISCFYAGLALLCVDSDIKMTEINVAKNVRIDQLMIQLEGVMNTQATIESKLKTHFSPDLCTVENETHMHNVPADAESHFKVTLVTDSFIGKMLVARHKMIYKLLSQELQNGVHALALHTYTKDEWSKKQGAPVSPPCLGGSK